MGNDSSRLDDAPTKEEPSVEAKSAKREKIGRLTGKRKRALAAAENARKRTDAARVEGREHGIALAAESLDPALDALALGIEAARNDPDDEEPRFAAHLEGLRNTRGVFETGLKALGVCTIAPEKTAFDPALHEAMQMQKTGATRTPGRFSFCTGQALPSASI